MPYFIILFVPPPPEHYYFFVSSMMKRSMYQFVGRHPRFGSKVHASDSLCESLSSIVVKSIEPTPDSVLIPALPPNHCANLGKGMFPSNHWVVLKIKCMNTC